MKTVREALQWGAGRLQHASTTPRLDAEVLLADVLGVSRAGLIARLHDTLARDAFKAFQGRIARRERGEPVAYIVGRKAFYGRDFLVDARVLIPRPETELLVERALARLADVPAPRIADIGTGSGCIAVTLAAERPDAHLIATDISEGALAVARANAERHGVADRVDFRRGSLLEPLDAPVHLIVANLPYVGTDEMEILAPDVATYEPHVALFAGPDGLALIRDLLAQVSPAVLLPGGALLLEIGYAQGDAVARLVRERWPHAQVVLHRDLAGLNRVVEISDLWLTAEA
ncbi:MAG: peptide chain release factor N(5)-glutamine methyltransferase [Ardenticatenia bacterium]|nr:MAG: peptide chain release factor N(5)-glutamine methyltransferase [Ardenticatenia bacterium]